MTKKIISYIISFILVIFLEIIIICSILNLTLLNKNYVIKQINKNNYYSKLSETINEKFKNHIMQSGMEDEIFKDIYTKDDLQNDFEKVLNKIYENKEIKIDTKEIKEKLNTNIEKYAQEHNIQITVSNREQINTFENTIINEYTSSIQYSNSILDTLAKKMPLIKTQINLYLEISTITAIILIGILILLNKKDKIKAIAYIGTALIATGGIIIVVLVYEKINLNLENSIIFDKTLSVLTKSIVRDIITKLFIIGGVNIIAGTIIAVMGNIAKVRKFR